MQLSVFGWGIGYDPDLYLRYAQEWRAGTAYTGSPVEYPPGAFPIFLIPLVLGGADTYRRAFAIEMACVDLAACVLVWKIAAMRARRWSTALAAPIVYTLATAVLYPILYARFDLAPAALVMAAIYGMHQKRFALSGVLLGAGGALKLWPLALVPIWLAWAARDGGRKRAISAGAGIALGVLLLSLPVLPLARWDALSALHYYRDRGIQLESTWATAALVAWNAGIASVRAEFEFGAFQVAGRVPDAFATVAPATTLLLALAPQVLVLRGWFGRARPGSARSVESFEYAALASTIGLLLGSKVLSPQFMLWIVPQLAIAADAAIDISSVIAMMVLTTLIYPYLTTALLHREAAGHAWTLSLLVCRNALLAGWYIIALRRASVASARAD